MNNNSRNLIGNLQSSAKAILDALIPEDSKVALLDYPHHTNVGDSLIWLGEVAYLSKRGISPGYVCDINNYDKANLKKSLNNDNPVILFHGGGNFGTLWPQFQEFRMRVLEDFAGVPVIQLPQSIYFDDAVQLQQTAQMICAHGKFTILTRDKPSFDLAYRHFDCDVRMCPDMAFFIGPVRSRIIPRFDRFILSRTDKEKKSGWHDTLDHVFHGLTVDIDDWLDSSVLENNLGRIESRTTLLRKHFDQDNRLLLRLWNQLARARMTRGVSKLQRGRVVIGDRLHAHILCVLLDKPHVLIDNFYNKLGNFHHAWTKPYHNVKLVNNIDEALEAASNFDFQLSLRKLAAG